VGLLKKPNVERAPAAAEVRFYADDTASVEWHGSLELLARSPAIYLDWAVSKDSNDRAASFLAAVREFLDDGGFEEGDRIATPQTAPFALPRSAQRADTAAGATTIIFTEVMRCKPSFRPRRAIVPLMYPTFWALWNELVTRVSADEPDAVEIFVDDLHVQIDYYATHGTGAGRGGRAHIYAAQVGASVRMRKEVAASAGLTLDEFDALSDDERNAIMDEYTARNVENMFDDQSG
jgi:hypothetical protein